MEDGGVGAGALGRTAEVEIHIEKRLPVQGGLGAGSANAVAALVGLEAELGLERRIMASHPSSKKRSMDGAPQSLWEIKIVPSQVSMARPGAPTMFQELGGPEVWDGMLSGWKLPHRWARMCRLFLIGGTVLGVDRGQEVSPLPDIEPVWCVVAVPEMGVSTAQAFRDWDALCAAEGLTAEASAVKLNELSRAYASAFQGAIPEGGVGTGSSGVLANE